MANVPHVVPNFQSAKTFGPARTVDESVVTARRANLKPMRGHEDNTLKSVPDAVLLKRKGDDAAHHELKWRNLI